MIKMIARRVLMTVLFMTALLTTYTAITGIQAKELTNWLIDKTIFVEEQPDLKNVLAAKATQTAVEKKTKESSAKFIETPKPPQSLEEAIDFSEYPAHKVVATGYTAGVESTGKTEDHPAYGLTYSGVKVKRDLYSTIAADTNVFPIGTVLFIPDYGYGVVADTGSAIKGNKIDLYFETVEDVYDEWGKKEVTVYLIDKGNGNLTERQLQQWNENETMQVFRKQYIES